MSDWKFPSGIAYTFISSNNLEEPICMSMLLKRNSETVTQAKDWAMDPCAVRHQQYLLLSLLLLCDVGVFLFI